jgi:Asp-tRNA(Asn)/Glu-tRNA(Gln) amidotransferase A subunit family amidase
VLSAGGLPLGLQLLGFPGRERDLSAIAGYVLEVSRRSLSAQG